MKAWRNHNRLLENQANEQGEQQQTRVQCRQVAAWLHELADGQA